MNNVVLYFLANAYSSFSPAFNVAAAICVVNSQNVPCPQSLNFLSPPMLVFLAPLVLLLVAVVVMIVASWKIFVKANQPGWAAIVPIYNVVVMLRIVKKPTWWVILTFIPFVNIIIGFIITYELAKIFGKRLGFTIGLILLPIIFIPILGFGKATYMPPADNLSNS